MAMVGMAAAGAVAGWLNSQEARKASEKERKRMERLLAQLQSPNFDMSTIDAPTYQLLEKYTPQVSDLVREANPTLVKADSEGAKRGRSAQREALERLRQVASTGTDPIAQAEEQAAANRAAIAHQGNVGQIRDSMARRGLGGGGMELALQLDSAQDAAARQAEAGRQAQAEAYRRRLGAIRESAALGGQIRGEDVDLESRNAAIINDFNSRMANAANAWNARRDAAMNEASRYNIGAAQDIANRNVSEGYRHRVGERDTMNDLRQRQFQNDVTKVTGQQSAVNMARDDIRANAKDNANAITGATDTAIGGLMYMDERDRRRGGGGGYTY
ncbi:MAG TPA: hypothetical protein VEC14_00800 [Reyranellaceae bacterium]|nr:hypothetical protein [Reyranellaceae bacterium]